MVHPGIISVVVVSSFRHWLFRLGGLGLIIVALIDNSFIPIPGGLDVFTILLSAKQHNLWPYYVVMSTFGAVVGGYLTYRIGVKGGKEVLEKRIGQKRAEKVYNKVENAGFTSIFVSVLIPPPFPIVPVLLAAGALQIPPKKFLSAVAAGRAIRFTIDAMLGVFYGHAIIHFFAQYYKPALYGLIGLAVAGGLGGLIYYKHWKHKKDAQGSQPQPRAA
jgi:membrane protein YqaA with SNARE-associated domain